MSDDTKDTEDAEVQVVPEEAEEALKGIPDSIRGWLLGQTQEEPPELAAAMDQVAERINMATAFIVVQRLAQMGQRLHFLREIEETLFDPARVKNMDAKERMGHYRSITKEANEFLEFTRKFTLQNKAMFSRKSQSDELAAILRELDPSVVQQLLKAVSKKGAGTTVNDLGALVKQEPEKPKMPTEATDLFNELMDGD